MNKIESRKEHRKEQICEFQNEEIQKKGRKKKPD